MKAKKKCNKLMAYMLIVAMLLSVLPDAATISYAQELAVQETTEAVQEEGDGEDVLLSETVEETTITEEEQTTEISTESTQGENVSEEITEESSSEETSEEPSSEISTESTELPDEEEGSITTEQEASLDEETQEKPLQPVVENLVSNVKTEGLDPAYKIYCDGTWAKGKYCWYVYSNGKKHYVFCLNHGYTMKNGLYYGNLTAGYSGISAFRKSVALNYFYKSNGNSWNGKNYYGDVQYAIWDWSSTDVSKEILNYANQAWKVSSVNSGRSAGSSSYSSLLKPISKSAMEDKASRKEMIESITKSKHIVDLSGNKVEGTDKYQDVIKLGGTAWKYFHNGGFNVDGDSLNGATSDIVVDGIYKPDGSKANDCTAALNSSGNLDVSITPLDGAGDTKENAYTVVMHINFDYQGNDSINYLLTEAGKQNLTYNADFGGTAYFAVKVWAKANPNYEKAKLYINKVDEFGQFVSGCTFQLTGVQGEATNMLPEDKTINNKTDYFKIEYPGYYKLIETDVPSSEFRLNEASYYVYATYNDESKLLLYEAYKMADGSYGFLGDGINAGIPLPYSHLHEGKGTMSFTYYFPNHYEDGDATLVKHANVLVRYENGKFVYEKRKLDDVGFTFHAAEDIYMGETLVFRKDAEIYSGTSWGTLEFPHTINITGKLVFHHTDRVTFDSYYRGYTATGGSLTISNLPPGSYYCVESDLSHPGLVMTIGKYYFDVYGGGKTRINGDEGILNETSPADVEVYKVDENTKEYLSGAEFTLYANIKNTNFDGEPLFTTAQTVNVVTARDLTTGKETVEKGVWIPIQTKVSADTGLALFENIPYGDYLIAETKAPKGYQLAEKTIRFTHSLTDNMLTDNASGFVFEYEVANIQTSTFSIYKNGEKAYLNTVAENNVDAYIYKDEPIEGVVFGIFAAEAIKNTLGEVVYNKGDLVKKCTTDAKGCAEFGGALFAGKYYYQELQTADDSRYIIDDTMYPFEVTGSESLKTLTENPIINKQYKGSIKVIKTDGVTTVPLSDVEFNLMDADGNVIGTYVTDAQGEITIENLPVGTYYLQETKTKENYKLDDTKHFIKVSKDNLDQVVSITNEEYKGSIKVIKTDGKNQIPLEGVEFDLLDENKKVISSYVTDSNGEIFIDGLSVGTYYLQETKTKKGYKLDDSLIEVVLTVDDLNQIVSFENYRDDTKITIKTDTTISGSGGVKTGDATPLTLIMILFLLSSFGAAYFAKKRNKLEPISVRAKKFMAIAILLGGVAVIGGFTVYATSSSVKETASKELKDAEYKGTIYEYALRKEYETLYPETEIFFPKEVDGKKLATVQYETIDTILQKEILETTKDYRHLFVKDESKVKDTIILDGNVYELQSITWSDVPNIETVNYAVNYGYQATEPTPDATYEYTYESPVTKEKNTVTLPFVRMEKSALSWVDGFSATVTFHNLDGKYFTIGNHEFEYNKNKLSLTDNDYKELVKMLGYDTSKYRLNSISWAGQPYKKNGVTCRDALATGQQYAASYKAHYEDEVENGKIYTAHATYSCEVELPAEEAAPTYVMQATGYYENTSVWANIITFVTEHKALSAIVFGGILLFIILAIVYVFMKRKEAQKPEEAYTGTED